MAIHSSEKYRQHLPVQGPRLTGRMLNFVQLVGLRQSWLAGQKPRKQRKGPQQRQRREEIFGSLCLCLGAIEAGTTVGVMVTGISQEEMKENEDHDMFPAQHVIGSSEVRPSLWGFSVFYREKILFWLLSEQGVRG